MRRLALSLIAVVMVATVAAGLVADRLFDAVRGTSGEPLDAWRALGRELADQVLDDDDPTPGAGWSLTTRADLALDAATPRTGERDALDVALESPEGLALESAHGLRVLYGVPGRTSVLAIEHPDAPSRDDALRLAATLLFYAALMALILLRLLPLLRRLSRLSDVARAFGRGELDARVATRRGSDLHTVESAFNAMAARMQRLIEDNRLLGSGVAHDLRTPLARLRFGIDTLAESGDTWRDDASLATHVARLQADVEAMEGLLEGLLSYARFDARHATLRRTPLDLATLVRRRVAALGPGDRTRIAVVDASTSNGLEGDARALAMLLDNLLQNALRHARSRVRIGLADADGTLELRVEDDGPGVPPHARERVFEPFVRRVDDAHDDDATAGHGLGLALVARIAERHDATVSIERSTNLGGCRCRVRFPR